MLILGLLASACTERAEEPRDRTGTGRAGQYATDSSRWGEVTIDPSSVVASGASDEDRGTLLEMIAQQHRNWLAQDTGALRDLMASDAIRVDAGSGLSEGADAIVAALPSEWEGNERPYGTIAQSFAIRDVELIVRGDVAAAAYWIDVHGGARWEFNRQRVGFDVYRRAGTTWELLFHQGADAQPPGAAAEADLPQMEFVYPAADLERAVAFYQPLLGEPDERSPQRLSYDLGDARFHFDTMTLGGLAEPTDGFPNGYAEFVIADIDAELARLRSVGVAVEPIEQNADGRSGALLQDPAGNVLVLRGRDRAEEAAAAGSLSLAPTLGLQAEIREAIEDYWNAWLTMDAQTLVEQLSPGGRVLFDTNSRGTFASEGGEELLEALAADWSDYDIGPAGVGVEVSLDRAAVRSLSDLVLASYEYRMSGSATSRVDEAGVATQLLERGPAGWTIRWSLFTTADDDDNDGLVLSLDYTGYPVVRVRRAERFYTNTLGLGSPYQDVAYRGWWTRSSVFGVYRARGLSPELLRPGRTNGYVSFWVRSVDRSLRAYLREQGSSFPLLPAINNRRGIDHQPGYTQLVATDSEGNIVLFSEYPGT